MTAIRLSLVSPKGRVRTSGNQMLYLGPKQNELEPENVAAFLRRWR